GGDRGRHEQWSTHGAIVAPPPIGGVMRVSGPAGVLDTLRAMRRLLGDCAAALAACSAVPGPSSARPRVVRPAATVVAAAPGRTSVAPENLRRAARQAT